MVNRLVSNFKLIMAESLWVVPFGNGDVGIYANGHVINSFGTPLVVRGPKREVFDFLASLDLTGKLKI